MRRRGRRRRGRKDSHKVEKYVRLGPVFTVRRLAVVVVHRQLLLLLWRFYAADVVVVGVGVGCFIFIIMYLNWKYMYFGLLWVSCTLARFTFSLDHFGSSVFILAELSLHFWPAISSHIYLFRYSCVN